MIHDDVTIVMQGPLKNAAKKIAAGLNHIEDYQKYVGNVVISTWDHYDTKPSKRMLRRLNVEYIEDDIRKYEDYYNDAHISYQTVSSLNGVSLSKTKYTIKLRCDEYYTDMSKFIDVMKSAPEKLTTSNFLFVADKWQQLHPSDHVMGCLTENIRGTFLEALKLCKEHQGRQDPLMGSEIGIKNYKNGNLNNDRISPETLLFLSFLRHKKVSINCERSKEIMNEHCQLVELKDMGEFLCHLGCNPYASYNYVLNQTPSITSMEEL